MADQLQLRRGTTAQIASFTGAQGEIVVDTDKDTIVVQDGATAGGFPLASEADVVDGTFYFNDDTGSGSVANVYILSPKSNTNTPTVYKDGQQLGFVTANSNTGPSTANFAGLGVKPLKWPGGLDPVAGDISGRVYLIYNQSSDWLEIQDIKRSFDYLNSLRINVASTGVVDLTTSAPNTRNINITGTTTITGFTVAAGQLYFVRFNAALTLTNGSGLVTQSGANITTAAGDTCIIRATAANFVEVLSYTSPYGKFTSAEQTVTAGGTITLSHLLGVMPKFAQAFLICKTAELGYSVGDEVPVSITISASSTFNYQLGLSATTIRAVCGNSGIGISNAAGGSTAATPANWRLIVRAWA